VLKSVAGTDKYGGYQNRTTHSNGIEAAGTTTQRWSSQLRMSNQRGGRGDTIETHVVPPTPPRSLSYTCTRRHVGVQRPVCARLRWRWSMDRMDGWMAGQTGRALQGEDSSKGAENSPGRSNVEMLPTLSLDIDIGKMNWWYKKSGEW
jgi:hypothetical protein